jgi:hypothetical protein
MQLLVDGFDVDSVFGNVIVGGSLAGADDPVLAGHALNSQFEPVLVTKEPSGHNLASKVQATGFLLASSNLLVTVTDNTPVDTTPSFVYMSALIM